jgi:hypothetical protein
MEVLSAYGVDVDNSNDNRQHGFMQEEKNGSVEGVEW